MPFQVICLRNKAFWNKVLTIMACFAMVIVVMAVVFPIQNESLNSQTPIITTQQTETQTEDNTATNV